MTPGVSVVVVVDPKAELLLAAAFLFLFFFHIISTFQLLLDNKKNRGHSCCPFSPPVLAFNFYRAYNSTRVDDGRKKEGKKC